MMWMRMVIVGLVLLGLAARAPAGGGPQNVAVVVNTDSWASKLIANEYIDMRGIPATNVVHLNGLPDFDTINVEAFREQILLPVLKTLWDRRVLPQVDYIVYSADLPTAIDIKQDLAGIKPEKFQTPVGSINGLTYLYQLVLKKDPQYAQLVVNFYMRRPTMGRVSSSVTDEDRKALLQSRQLLAAKQWEAAARIMEPLAAKLPESAELQYNLACCLARLGRETTAVEALGRAVSAGWSNRKHAEADDDLQLLRGAEGFTSLLAKMDENSKRPFDVQPTTGFRSVYQWTQQGENSQDGVLRYMLSTVLAVTSGRGNSVKEALNSLRRSVAADATHPQGTIYFMENGDVRENAAAGIPFRGTSVGGNECERGDCRRCLTQVKG